MLMITSKFLCDFFCATYGIFQFLAANCISSGSDMITLTKNKKQTVPASINLLG